MAADWFVSAWDQNSVLRYATPAIAAIEDAAGHWLLQLLRLPEESDVGFVTGATMANFTGLAAARWRLLQDAGWNLERDGLFGAPRIHCLVGEERHETVDVALRYLGMGSPTVVPADGQGRIDAAELDCPGPDRAGPFQDLRPRFSTCSGAGVPAGREPPLRGLRSLRPGHRGIQSAWRLGARGRRHGAARQLPPPGCRRCR